MDRQRDPDVSSGVSAELARCPLFPAVKPDVDLEDDDGCQQHDAQTDLHPLVKLVAPTILDLVDAPREDQRPPRAMAITSTSSMKVARVPRKPSRPG